MRNPYTNQIQQTLPRLLALFDQDRTGKSLGIGDRFYWAWGLIDFPNGTFQGAVHGLARLWQSGLWPYQSDTESFIARLDSLVSGARFATRRNGSCEEAFPHESSYCVTALVAYDILSAAEILGSTDGNEKTLQRWRQTVAPMIDFLKSHDETHAIISNHLATAVAALTRWHRDTGDTDAEHKAQQLMRRILDHQSSEGWFEEYGGPDPGYQTLCLHYLADVHRIRPDWELLEPITRSLRFLWYCAHPDGSFGGVYGSRYTRFYYPSGILALADDIPEAAALAAHMARSIEANTVVTLAAMDEPNLIPMFNSYCWAAELCSQHEHAPQSSTTVLPCLRAAAARTQFPEAGLVVDQGPEHYTIVSTRLGGALSHFKHEQAAQHNTGVVVRDPKGRFGSTWVVAANAEKHLDGDTLIVDAPVGQMTKRLPDPAGFWMLRTICSTLFRFGPLREWAKRQLASWLITKVNRWPAKNVRTIELGYDLIVTDDTTADAGYVVMNDVANFVPIHMASQGYWQLQDEENSQ